MTRSSGGFTMQKNILTIAAISMVVSLNLLPAFAGQMKTDLLQNKTVTIQQNASNVAKVTDVKVKQNYTGSIITGKVVLLSKTNAVRHRAIPGHVDISILDTNGNSTKLASVHYSKISIKSRYAKFRYDLAITPKSGSTLVITHNPKNYN